MTIGLLSNISVASLAGWLDGEHSDVAATLSDNVAPAVTTLALEWLKSGHRLVVFTLDAEARSRYTLKGERLTVYVGPALAKSRPGRMVAPFGRDVKLLLKMIRSADEKIDVVSAQWTRDYALAARYFFGRCKVFVTVRDIMPYIIRQIHGLRNYPWYVTYIKNEVVMRDRRFAFIANSSYTASAVKRYWNVEAPVVPNPVDDRYLGLPSGSSRDRRSEFRIVSISMSAPDDVRKNILTLLDAFAMVRAARRDVTLELIGPSFHDADPTVRKLTAEGRLEGVVLSGALSHDEVVEHLRRADLMVHPSLEETFGNTIVEAMAVECPVLGGRDSGAVPYVLDGGGAGFLCDVTSSEAIAGAITEVMNDDVRRADIAASAKKYCRENFSSAAIAAAYISIFSK